MDYTQPDYWPQLKALAGNIDTLDYFQILNLQQSASSVQIRDSYYQLARALHPDKFFHIDDEATKDAVHKIYKRVVEAYTILKEEKKRLIYLKDIAGPERDKKLRFTEESEAVTKEHAKAALKIAKTPKGEQLYQAALIDMQNSRWDKAYKNLQTAVMFEPGNVELKNMLNDVDKKRKGS